jgi:DnaJ-class molecular chaperone
LRDREYGTNSRTDGMQLSKKHHPDTGGDTDKFLEINEAYHTLGDEGRR